MSFFRNAVKNLNIEPCELFSVGEYFLNEVDDPIFRALDRHIKTNFRPVSILPALSKITEVNVLPDR